MQRKDSPLDAVLAAAVMSLYLIFPLVILVGPWLIVYVIPTQAYHITYQVAEVALVLGIVSLIASIWRPARAFTAFTLYAAALGVISYLWVYSTLLVGGAWGIIALYLVNFFIGVGTIFSGFAVSLFAGDWSRLGEQVGIGVVVTIFFAAGGFIAEHADKKEKEAK